MEQQETSAYLDDIMADTFEGAGKWNNRPIRYIFLSLIRRRPHDLINLCTLAARNANAEGRNLIDTEDREEVSLMRNVYDCVEAFGKLLDKEYHLVLGRKKICFITDKF